MIDKFQFDPVDGLQNATAYPDDPGNEEAFREQLQRPLNQVKEYVNSLVDAYAKTEAGRSGAEEIGSEAISGLMDPSNPLQPALTVRKQLQAAQKNIDDIIAGIIPDGSVNTEKIADGAVTPDKVSGGVGCNYIRNRIPTTGDDFNLGYKVGDTWTVPDMTLNNLIPHATAITPADWTLQNGSLAGSGSKGTLTCGNGLEAATAKISIAPIPGHVYALFGALKVTSANVITSISLGADQKTAPVKDTAYNLCEIITAPAEFKIQITAASAAALNGATVEFDKVCIVDMTADMVGVPFDRAGAIEYFSSRTAFISQEPEYAGMHWYCKGSGVWQSSSQLSDETKELYGVNTVDDALKSVTPYPITSYSAFAGNVNTKMLCSAFVPSFLHELEHRNVKIGMQLMKYLSDFQSVSFTEVEKSNFIECNDWYECCFNPIVRNKFTANAIFLAMMNTIPFAKYVYDSLADDTYITYLINTLCGTSHAKLSDIIKTTATMQLVMQDQNICERIRYSTELEKIMFGADGERLTFLSGSGNFVVPNGVENLNYILVSNGGSYTGSNVGKILSGSLGVTPGQTLAYSIGADTTFGVKSTASGATISNTNCSLLTRASDGLNGEISGSRGSGGGGGGGGFGAEGGQGNNTAHVSGNIGGKGGAGYGTGGNGGNGAGGSSSSIGGKGGTGQGGKIAIAMHVKNADQITGNSVKGLDGIGLGVATPFADALMNASSYRNIDRTNESILTKKLTSLGIFGGAGGGQGGKSDTGGTGGAGGNGASGALGGTTVTLHGRGSNGVIMLCW